MKQWLMLKFFKVFFSENQSLPSHYTPRTLASFLLIFLCHDHWNRKSQKIIFVNFFPQCVCVCGIYIYTYIFFANTKWSGFLGVLHRIWLSFSCLLTFFSILFFVFYFSHAVQCVVKIAGVLLVSVYATHTITRLPWTWISYGKLKKKFCFFAGSEIDIFRRVRLVIFSCLSQCNAT